jgi:hypothetical protein
VAVLANRRPHTLSTHKVDLKDMEDSDVWGKNPANCAHPLPVVYNKITETVVKITGPMEDSSDGKRHCTDSLEVSAGSDIGRRGRSDSFGSCCRNNSGGGRGNFFSP